MFNEFQTEIKMFLVVATLAIVIALGGILLLKATQTPQPSTVPQLSSSPDETANEIDYYSCKDLEKLPFQYVRNEQFSIGYIDMSGTVELRSDGTWYLERNQEVKGVYLRIPMQKTGEKSLFYLQFIEEAKGDSANADIEGEDLLFRLGEYDNENIFSSRATIPQNFQSEIEKALQNKIPINLHLVIDIPPSRDAPSNTSGACKIDIF